MALSKKSIDEFKRIFKEKYGEELNDGEAHEAARNLLGFFETLFEIDMRDRGRKRRLRKEPEGFHITDGIYNYCLCHRQVTGDESWYDQWGVKCLLCQKAVKEGIVPGFACVESDSRYLMWEMKDKFKLHPATVRKLVRQGKLKARIVTCENGRAYEYIFLKKENPDLIDPDRYSPARKSYNRHQDKVYNIKIREFRKKHGKQK